MEQHDEQLHIFLDKLLAAGMALNKAKCQFGVPKVECFGHIIDKDGIHAGSRLQGIIGFPQPKDVPAIRSFLGMAKFSEKLAETSAALRG